MAAAVPIAVAVIGAAVSVYTGVKQREAAKEQEDIAKRNAEREQAEAEEMARRERKRADYEESLDRARAAASGIDVDKSKSNVIYMNERKKANRDQIDWIRKSGASRADIIKREGRLAADMTRIDSWKSFGQAASYGAQAAGASYDWYKSTQKPKKTG